MTKQDFLDNVKVFGQSSIKFNESKIVYFDPLQIDEDYHDADIIFITHEHYDHFSPEDISKIVKDSTKLVLPEKMKNHYQKTEIKEENVIVVEPEKEYEVDRIKFETIRSYNTMKPFHLKNMNWVGYKIYFNDVSYYIAGDTDITLENKLVKCDVAFLPIGGTYTMNYKEAASLANIIRPQVVVPIHYGSIVGQLEDGYKFKELVEDNMDCEIMIF